MQIRAFLRKRLHIHVELVDPALPSLAASGESAPTVGGWFSANFGVGNLLSVLTLIGGLIGGYATLKSEAGDNSRRIASLNDRLRTDYVRKDDYDTNNKASDARFHNLESGQTQIMGHLLEEKR